MLFTIKITGEGNLSGIATALHDLSESIISDSKKIKSKGSADFEDPYLFCEIKKDDGGPIKW